VCTPHWFTALGVGCKACAANAGCCAGVPICCTGVPGPTGGQFGLATMVQTCGCVTRHWTWRVGQTIKEGHNSVQNMPTV